jgi:hypothetical protein
MPIDSVIGDFHHIRGFIKTRYFMIKDILLIYIKKQQDIVVGQFSILENIHDSLRLYHTLALPYQ